MPFLYNRLSKKEAVQKVKEEAFLRRTVSFYRYVTLRDPEKLRDQLFIMWSALGVLGRVYLAKEGINAQISVPEPSWQAFEKTLQERPEFEGVPFKFAVQEGLSFWKLMIKVRKQIVADGLSPKDCDVSNVGEHLDAEAWNLMLEEEDSIVVDMRNHYESRIGRFQKAITPQAETFEEELPLVKKLLQGKKDKKVLLYCTGGIRCEKASSYLRHAGFQKVYQLYGGIIEYAHQVKKRGLASQFKGKNFVFDERLEEAITDDVLTHCDQCHSSCDRYVNCANAVCNLLFIQCKSCEERFHGACSEVCQAIAVLPTDRQKAIRKGVPHQNRFAFVPKALVR